MLRFSAPISSPLAGGGRLRQCLDRVRDLLLALWCWNERRRTAFLLRRLDDRILYDIGLQRGQIESVVRGIECDFVPSGRHRHR